MSLDLDLVSDLCVSEGHPVVSSLKVAERFGKRHDNVIRDIRKLATDLPEDFCLLNFEECFKINELANGKREPYFNLTRDGFSLLVMGFTGKEALAWKVRFLEAFSAMERRLLEGFTRPTPGTAELSTTADREPLVNLINVWARLGCIHHRDAYTMVAARYALPKATMLPKAWVQDAIDWVQSQIDDVQVRRLAPAMPAAEVSEKLLSEAKAEGVMTMALAMDKAAQLRPKTAARGSEPVAVHVLPDVLLAMSGLIVKVATLLAGCNAPDEDIRGAVAQIIQNGMSSILAPAAA